MGRVSEGEFDPEIEVVRSTLFVTIRYSNNAEILSKDLQWYS